MLPRSKRRSVIRAAILGPWQQIVENDRHPLAFDISNLRDPSLGPPGLSSRLRRFASPFSKPDHGKFQSAVSDLAVEQTTRSTTSIGTGDESYT